MATVIQYLTRALTILSQVLGIAQTIQGIVSLLSTSQQVNTIQDTVNTIITQNETEITDLANLQADLTIVKDNVQTILDTAATGSDLSAFALAFTTFTESWPATWDLGASEAIWNFQDIVRHQTMQSYNIAAGLAWHFKGGIFTYDRTPFTIWPWKVVGDWTESSNNDPLPNTPPGFDTSEIISSDMTAFEYVTRAHPEWGAVDLGDGLPAVNEASISDWLWVLDLDNIQWYVLKQSLGLATVPVPAAPIWPGLSGVTLGSPVSLVDGLVVTGPLQGVIVSISAAAPGKQKFLYGTVAAYQHIGALSFEDDNSDQESFQALEFENQFYLPKSMLVASSVRFKANPGTTGTVTPFTIP